MRASHEAVILRATFWIALPIVLLPITACGSSKLSPATKVTPEAINFGEALVGTPTQPRSIVVSNIGESPLTISSIRLTGSGAPQVQIDSHCGVGIPAQGVCKIDVINTPVTTRLAKATLVISDNSSRPLQAVAVEGKGDVDARISVSNSDFGEVLPGTTSAPQIVTLTNPGNTPMPVGNISLTGADASNFIFSSSCGTSLAAFGSCSIQVLFAPPVTGPESATLTVADGALNSPQTVAFTGFGSAEALEDVILYSATPAGIMAAIEAAQHGMQVLVLEPTDYIGGMVTNGLGYSDGYSTAAIGGLAARFFDALDNIYAGVPDANHGHTFEPHVAEQVLNSMIAQNRSITVLRGKTVASVQKKGSVLTGVVTTDGKTYYGREFIDASYTGDLMAKAQVSYTVGRESSAQYNESMAGTAAPIQLSAYPIPAFVDPGDARSGLIAHVGIHRPGPIGSADKAVMAYNYRLCLSSDPTNQIPFAAPENYDPAEFEILGREALLAGDGFELRSVLGPGKLPNQKFDLNNVAEAFSTDEIGESFGYPDGPDHVRLSIEAEQKHYLQGLLYFLSTDSRIPTTVRAQVKALGLCKDEFTDNGGWPRQIYVREARRMIGAYVETQNDVQLRTSIPDSIGVGGYPIDDHVNYMFSDAGVIQIEFNGGFILPLYPIPYRILTPQASEATNLLVPVDVSASHIAYDSLRIEETYMIMGQAAGAAAALAIENGTSVQGVDYGLLRSRLLDDKAVIVPPQ